MPKGTIKFITGSSVGEGIAELAHTIGDALKRGMKVLWLVPGGSNVPISVAVMDMIQSYVSEKDIANLIFAQADERYGPVGHKDSNWQQLLDTGLKLGTIRAIPILRGLLLAGTVNAYETDMRMAYKEADIIIGQFGIGADGHIAGILPHSPAVDAADDSLVTGYEAQPFTRVTLTFRALRKISSAFLFASGESKKEALDRLQNQDMPLAEEPAQILKQMSEARVYFHA